MRKGYNWDELAPKNPLEVSESLFLAEAAWAILSCGLSERVVRGKFGSYSAAFVHWTSAQAILESRKECEQAALAVIDHPGKVAATVSFAEALDTKGLSYWISRLSLEGPQCLEQLPFFGHASSAHLAKNIGFDVVKPDRHLIAVAHAWGYAGPNQLCSTIESLVGDRISTVDTVFWSFAALSGRHKAAVLDGLVIEEHWLPLEARSKLPQIREQ